MGLMDDDKSMDAVRHHKVIPRIDTIQAKPKARRDMFGEGTLILSPGDGVLCKLGEYVDVVPIFFYDEWIVWADRDDPNNSVMERTLDPNSEVAKKAADPHTREEEYEGGFTKIYTHVLQYCLVLYSGDMKGSLCVIGFSKGEFFYGQNWSSAMFMRKVGGKQAPMWSQVWRITPSERDRKGHQWFGPDYLNGPQLLIKPEEAKAFKQLHEETKADFEAKKLSVDYSGVEKAVSDEDSEM